jgi:hypothetical protein
MRKKSFEEDPDEEFLELYGEYVSLKEIGISTALSVAGAFVLYFSAPYIAEMLKIGSLVSALKITLGAVGASIGFLISIPLTRVKRKIVVE